MNFLHPFTVLESVDRDVDSTHLPDSSPALFCRSASYFTRSQPELGKTVSRANLTSAQTTPSSLDPLATYLFSHLAATQRWPHRSPHHKRLPRAHPYRAT